MKYLLFCGLSLMIAVTATGCRPRSPELPIPKEKLVPLLADVQLAEALLQNLYGREKDSTAMVYYQKICSLHGVEKSQLDTTLVLLQDDPKRMQEIFGEVLELLSVREAAVQ